MSVEGIEFLRAEDMNKHSMWFYDENTELLYPILKDEDFPDYNRNLFIRAIFKTANGINLNGYILGIKNIYSIAIFYNKQIFSFNKNFHDVCLKVTNQLCHALKIRINSSEIFPIYYKTLIDYPGLRNIDGEFDIFKPRTDCERLDF